jgi:phospholipase D1/2
MTMVPASVDFSEAAPAAASSVRDAAAAEPISSETALAATAVSASAPTNTPLLQPGATCWRIEQATRLQFLIDGEEYFGALRAALRRAQHSIFILGWDIDSRMALQPRAPDDDLPIAFGEFLNTLVARHRSLRAYVLSWDYAMLFALERELLPTVKLHWRTHRRLQFRLDNKHPTGASHHQKVVVIDDRVAFVGGLDITRCRWDTAAHAPHDRRRVDADGKPYGAFHDVQIIVEGPVAAALGELARERWLRSTGQAPRVRIPTAGAAPHADGSIYSPWPPHLPAVLKNVQVAISRTEPEFAGHAAVGEIRQLYSAAIAAARRWIFLENQYFSSAALRALLAARLADEDAPEIVAIGPRRASGWLEESTMGVLRARIYRDLQNSDRWHRFRPYYPVIDSPVIDSPVIDSPVINSPATNSPVINNPATEERVAPDENLDAIDTNDDSLLNVHSKVMIVDDELLTIGSANLSNRSMYLDTECNLALEASTQGEQADNVRRAIALLRNRLLGEHLGVASETVAAATQRQGLIGAIESLRGGARTLLPARGVVDPEIDKLLPEQALIDPEQPLAADYVVAQYVPPEEHRTARGHATLIVIATLLLGGLALAWRVTPLHDYLDLQVALRIAERLQAQPLTPLWVLLSYVVAGLAMVPVVLLIGVTGMVFGPLLGTLYAVGGSLLSAAATYWIGRKLGEDTLQRFARGRLQRLRAQLELRGLWAIAAIRLMPIAPFTLVNLLAGAARIRLRHFLLGTLFGMLPGIIATVVFIDRIVATLRSPSVGSLSTLAAVLVAIVGIALSIQRWLRGRPQADSNSPSVAPSANITAATSQIINSQTINSQDINSQAINSQAGDSQHVNSQYCNSQTVHSPATNSQPVDEQRDAEAVHAASSAHSR